MVDVVKLAAAVFGEGAIGFAGFIGIAEVANHELVDVRSVLLFHGGECDGDEEDGKDEVFHFFDCKTC